MQQEEPQVILYTDGACTGNPGPGGWAAILKDVKSGRIKKLSGSDPETTNNRMELQAVIEGLRTLKPSRRWRVHLVSDSEYVVFGLTRWMAGWIRSGWRRGRSAGSQPVKNAELWKALLELTMNLEMSYAVVRGHSGHPENEECDRLAVLAAKSVTRGKQPNDRRRAPERPSRT